MTAKHFQIGEDFHKEMQTKHKENRNTKADNAPLVSCDRGTIKAEDNKGGGCSLQL